MIEINSFGETCPKPVIRAMKALQDPAAKGCVRVLVDNTVAVENLKRLAASKQGSASVDAIEGGWAVTIAGVSAEAAENPEGDDAALAQAGIACPVPDAPSAQRPVTVFVGSKALGQGAPELGNILIKGLVYAMSQAEVPPHRIVFFNDGAALTCEGSELVEDVRELERRGCEVLTCGTCLDFHGLRDKLAVGGVTNLYAISEFVLGPDKIVTL
ncbi:sulfurtransferase-like selenium metabolism protein YedF [Collinsella tanakaei]|uniref:sulfurtransferase-like selenium metabolism protein YedF n=1 Tax=Collinsella tanakaei TaxID=626935 RepID=UPI0025A378BA|nr:sulfurtransferase-like selenium metabolism protein YedF [Collinsella tanakaei]MDM8299726.1 sulfurtransferase-like selenium metabolism protein YedF [Collinsella tanakaei]